MKRLPVPANSEVEPILWDDWHVVAEAEQVMRSGSHVTQLLGTPITILPSPGTGGFTAVTSAGQPVHTQHKYGFVWACLGSPVRDIISFSECEDEDRWIVTGGPIGVAVSGLRAVENFLDMGHFAFVHTGYLGEEPFTEIRSYKVAPLPDGGIIATDCKVYQPLASPVATEGFDVDYVYAVRRPYTVLLYKANPAQPQRQDLIVLFVQPVSEEACVAHMLLVYIKEGLQATDVRRFAQLIFSQDKPILENQVPKRLPLSSRTEVPVRADASSAAYRRWLREAGISYGAITGG
jgi:phenylpropionate dioxygenase-like ring-hydroxylating dioxygenase large terminal subunit